jgi:surfeit locus 1 family protein
MELLQKMVRPPSIPRTIAALVLLGLAVVLLVSLGRWQIRRGDERRAIQSAIESGRRLSPLMLAPDTPSSQLTPWRPARATGRWLNDRSVWLENRNYKGRPGYWVATPFAFDAAAGHAVLVLRGWVPRATPGQPEPKMPPAPGGTQTIQGELTPHVPRLFELWSLGKSQDNVLPPVVADTHGDAPHLQNLDLTPYARATGLTFIPAVLEQTGPSDEHFVRDWPQPSVDFNENDGYSLQWFAFAAIAAVAWLVVLGRALGRFRSSFAKRKSS